MNKMAENQPPIKKWKAGGLQLDAWQNKSEANSGEYHTYSYQRNYKDKSGEWKKTQTLRANDLPKLRLLLEKAFEWEVSKEPEKSE